jgi:hypothetical protein
VNSIKLTLKTANALVLFIILWVVVSTAYAKDKELIFIANSRIHDLSDFNFRNKIRSLKIDCKD